MIHCVLSSTFAGAGFTLSHSVHTMKKDSHVHDIVANVVVDCKQANLLKNVEEVKSVARVWLVLIVNSVASIDSPNCD